MLPIFYVLALPYSLFSQDNRPKARVVCDGYH